MGVSELAGTGTAALASQERTMVAGSYPVLEALGGVSSAAQGSINGLLVGGWWFNPATITIDRLGYVVGAVTGSAGAVIRLGIYAVDAFGHPVGAPLAEVGNLSGTAAINTGVDGALGAPVRLGPGWYAPCLELQGTPATVTQVVSMTSVMGGMFPAQASAAPPVGLPIDWYVAGSAVAATGLPVIAPATALLNGGFRPLVSAHVLTVP